MSFHIFFAFSTGLKETLMVPPGTKQALIDRVKYVEDTLNLKREQYGDNSIHWDSRDRFADVDDEVLCKTVETHNSYVRRFYRDLGEWAENPLTEGEALTPEDAKEFWHGLEILNVDPDRWTADYFRARMEALYEVMRGREAEGISFDEKPLTPKQAAAVIRIFDQYLDPADLRLDVPDGTIIWRHHTTVVMTGATSAASPSTRMT